MKILVVQLRRVGDILLTTPVLRYLKEAQPGVSVDFLCEPMGRLVLESNPFLDNLLVYDKARPWQEIRRIRGRRYDAVLDFMNNPRSTALTVLSGAGKTVGFRVSARGFLYKQTVPVPVEPEYVPARKLRLVKAFLAASGAPAPEPTRLLPELHLSAADRSFRDEWIQRERLTDKPYVVLAPAHRHPIRAWRAEGFTEVALGLAKKGFAVYLAWGPGEEAVVTNVRAGNESRIGLLPATSLRQMAAIFERSALLVTNDSGAMHLAVAINTPTVTVYGPTRPVDWNPGYAHPEARHAYLTASSVPCLGCHRLSCPVGHLCMKEMDATTVLNACERVMEEKR